MIIFTLLTLVVSQNETLMILYPQELATKAELQQINYNIVNFGFVPYGQRISGLLKVADPYTFCTPIFNTSLELSSDYPNVKVLLVQRGECSLYIKTLNAQLSGYQILVLVDNMDEDVLELNLVNLNKKNEIDISAILISKKQGELIKQYMDAITNDRVYIAVNFPDVLKTDIVKYHYWFSAMDKDSYQFLQQFYPFHMEMRDQLEFTPHYEIARCERCKKYNYLNPNQNCLSGGRYCATDPDGDGPLNGQDAVREIVRQLCIFKQDQIKWWKYIIKYSNLCLSKMYSPFCSTDIMTNLGIDPDEVQVCYVESFNYESDELADNYLLSEQYKTNLQYSILQLPILYINDIQYKGVLTVYNQTTNQEISDQKLFDTAHFEPLQTICKSYKDQSLPNICKQRMIGRIDDEIQVEHTLNSNIWVIWVVVLSTLAILIFCTIFLCRRMFRREVKEIINQQFNFQLAQYSTMIEDVKYTKQ